MAVDMSGLVEEIENYARQLRDAAAADVLASCKEDCPVSEVTPTNPVSGTLRDSLEIVDVDDDGTVFSFAIQSEVDYASFTDEEDTVEHPIRAKYAPRLRFWWEDGPAGAGIYHYKQVTHPGTKGQHWFASKNEERFNDALERSVESA